MSLLRKKSIENILSEAHESSTTHSQGGLKKILGVKDLTFLGMAAIIGAGVFSTIGTAAYNGGPGIVFLFVITAITCGFSALCYAEFASRVPISGSAYTYAYVSFGEIIAWIIGWALILEYAIGNIVVAISWSGYFNNLLQAFHIHLPEWLLTNPFSAKEGFVEAQQLIQSGTSVSGLTRPLREAYLAYTEAPLVAGYKFIINLPAFLIVAIITFIAYLGIKESKRSTNFMVVFKVLVILFIIVFGFFYVDTSNWSPFLPNGFTGVLAGVSSVFYAYIGFDAISTTAEECKNPQRDLPRGMINSLVICTILYILISLVLTGMVHYSELKVDDPLAYVFERLQMGKIGYLVSVSAVIATTSVLLVFQLGQPRIWMSMSRDGLLPKKFSKVHPKFHTPSFATIITGIVVGIPTLFLPGSIVTDLTSIGTLFAFVLVCLGVLVLPKLSRHSKKFNLPYINGKYIIPIALIIFFYTFSDRIKSALLNINDEGYQEILFLIFIIIAAVIAFRSFVKNLSFIPVFGALCCLYLMIEIPAMSWFWFFVWMGTGLLIYFLYSRKNSRLNKKSL